MKGMILQFIVVASGVSSFVERKIRSYCSVVYVMGNFKNFNQPLTSPAGCHSPVSPALSSQQVMLTAEWAEWRSWYQHFTYLPIPFAKVLTSANKYGVVQVSGRMCTNWWTGKLYPLTVATDRLLIHSIIFLYFVQAYTWVVIDHYGAVSTFHDDNICETRFSMLCTSCLELTTANCSQ